MARLFGELLPLWILGYLDRRKRPIAEVAKLRDERRQRRICVLCGEKYALPDAEKCDDCRDSRPDIKVATLEAASPWR